MSKIKPFAVLTLNNLKVHRFKTEEAMSKWTDTLVALSIPFWVLCYDEHEGRYHDWNAC